MKPLTETGPVELGKPLASGAQETQQPPVVSEAHGLGRQTDQNANYGSATLLVRCL